MLLICSTFAKNFGERKANNTKYKIYYEGKKTLDNPDDGNDTDSRRRFGGRRTVV